jgi:L-amino acid N-acyltransferase YncA
MPVVELRDAVEGDLPAILDIYNEVILTSTAVCRRCIKGLGRAN